MKSAIGLATIASLGAFSWFSWNGYHESISTNLTATANTVLTEHGLNDVSIKYDHLDGHVQGAIHGAQQDEVRGLLAKLPGRWYSMPNRIHLKSNQTRLRPSLQRRRRKWRKQIRIGQFHKTTSHLKSTCHHNRW